MSPLHVDELAPVVVGELDAGDLQVDLVVVVVEETLLVLGLSGHHLAQSLNVLQNLGSKSEY